VLHRYRDPSTQDADYVSILRFALFILHFALVVGFAVGLMQNTKRKTQNAKWAGGHRQQFQKQNEVDLYV
jgi:hypothetical protein